MTRNETRPWNPKGSTIEVAKDTLRADSWTLKGAGAHGSDIEVVSADHYLNLAAKAQNAQHAVAMWAEIAKQAKERLGRALEIGERMHECLTGEDGLVDADALAAWDDLMADEFVLGIKGDLG